MNLPTNQEVSLRDVIQIIPEYNGSNIPLSEFLEACTEAKEMIGDAAEKNLVRLIRGRLSGEARKTICGEKFDTIESLQLHLKNMFAPTKSVHQLMGELGNEFQQDDENVINFANRIKELGKLIIETQRLKTGNTDNGFKQLTENNMVECFKRGLKPEIDQRLPETKSIKDIVKESIKIEKNLHSVMDLRRKTPMYQSKTNKKIIYACQICKSEDHETGRCKPKTENCDFCKKPGHTIDQCYTRKRQENNTQTCQICNKTGHTAKDCYQLVECQFCGKKGHSARYCKGNISNKIVCQICNRAGHSANECSSQKSSNNQLVEARAAFSCQICNRQGHAAATCYSKDQSRSSQSKPTCTYCKNIGHTKEECRKLKFRQQQSGNGQGPSMHSAITEDPKKTHTMNSMQLDEELFELVPLG